MEFIPEWPFIRMKETSGEDPYVQDSIPWNSSFNGEGNVYLSSDDQPRNKSAVDNFDPTLMMDEKPEETLSSRWQAKISGAMERLQKENPEAENRLSTLAYLNGESPAAWSHVLRRWNKSHPSKADANTQNRVKGEGREDTQMTWEAESRPNRSDSARTKRTEVNTSTAINRLKEAQEAAFDVHRKMGKDSDLFVSYAVARRRAMLG